MTHQTLSLRKYWKLVPSTLINQAWKNPAMDLHFNSTKKGKLTKNKLAGERPKAELHLMFKFWWFFS